MRIAVVVTLLVSASLFSFAGPVAALDASLRGAAGFSSGAFTKLAGSSCNGDGSGEIRYTASHPLSGPLGGTMTTNAIVTLVPAAPNTVVSPITAFAGTFTITGGAEAIDGTLSLAPARPYTPGGSAQFGDNLAICSSAYFDVTARFTASDADGVFEEGYVKLAGANSRPSVPSNLARAEFWVAPEISISSGSNIDEAGLHGTSDQPPENVGGQQLTIRVFPPPIDQLEIRVLTTDGTAIAGQDYTPVDQTILIPGTAELNDYDFSQTIVVALNDDTEAEGLEQFTASVEILSGHAFVETSPTTAQIVDNDPYATTVTIADVSKPEGSFFNSASVWMEAAEPVTTSVFVCLAWMGGGTATMGYSGTPVDDYSFESSTCTTRAGGAGWGIQLNPGQTEARTRNLLMLHGDSLVESDETIELVVDWIWGATLLGDSTVTITILNDDAEPTTDANGDGVADAIAGDGARSFDDGSGTTGRILTGTAIRVEDAVLASYGVRITTTTDSATVEACGAYTFMVGPNSDLELTCGSISVHVTSGITTIALGPNGHVTVSAGADVTIDRTVDGSYTATNNGTTPVQVTRGGTTVTITQGTKVFSKPQTKDDCKNDGWRNYGIYRNQGQCVSSVASKK